MLRYVLLFALVLSSCGKDESGGGSAPAPQQFPQQTPVQINPQNINQFPTAYPSDVFRSSMRQGDRAIYECAAVTNPHQFADTRILIIDRLNNGRSFNAGQRRYEYKTHDIDVVVRNLRGGMGGFGSPGRLQLNYIDPFVNHEIHFIREANIITGFEVRLGRHQTPVTYYSFDRIMGQLRYAEIQCKVITQQFPNR